MQYCDDKGEYNADGKAHVTDVLRALNLPFEAVNTIYI